MKIGYPNHPRKDVLEEIKWIGENNFDFIDFYMEEDKCVPGKFDVEKAKQLLKKYNLDIVGHMAYYLAIGSPSKIIRDSAIKQAEEYFKVFKKLGVKYATIHANWAPGFFTLNEAVNFQIDSLKKLVQLAKKYIKKK